MTPALARAAAHELPEGASVVGGGGVPVSSPNKRARNERYHLPIPSGIAPALYRCLCRTVQRSAEVEQLQA